MQSLQPLSWNACAVAHCARTHTHARKHTLTHKHAQYANAMGGVVTALDLGTKKEEEVKRLGAVALCDTTDPAHLQAWAGKLDVIINWWGQARLQAPVASLPHPRACCCRARWRPCPCSSLGGS